MTETSTFRTELPLTGSSLLVYHLFCLFCTGRSTLSGVEQVGDRRDPQTRPTRTGGSDPNPRIRTGQGSGVLTNPDRSASGPVGLVSRSVWVGEFSLLPLSVFLNLSPGQIGLRPIRALH